MENCKLIRTVTLLVLFCVTVSTRHYPCTEGWGGVGWGLNPPPPTPPPQKKKKKPPSEGYEHFLEQHDTMVIFVYDAGDGAQLQSTIC